MRLRVHFGSAHVKEVSWYQDLQAFPNLIKFLGRNYEWAMYDTDKTGQVDSVFHFSELGFYDPNFAAICPLWSEMYPENDFDCCCGAGHTSFPFDHMRMCPKWVPWDKV